MRGAVSAARTVPARAEFSRAASWSLAVTSLTLALAYGVWYAYSVILVALLREFGWSRSVLAGAFSVFTLVHGAANPILGWLCDRVGPRRVVLAGGILLAASLWTDSLVQSPADLYLAFGLFTAVGVATAGWTPAVILVQRHFTERLGLALGIAGSGIGVGIFLVVPLCQALIDAFGWRWAFRGLALLSLAWILPATWLAVGETGGAAGSGPRAGTDPAGARAGRGAGAPGGSTGGAATAPWASAAVGPSLLAALATAPFWLIAGAKFLGNITSQTLHVHQAAFLVDHGLTPMVAAWVISVVGVASIVGKTGGGWLSDILGREGVYVLGMLGMMAGVGVLALVAGTPSAWLAYGYAALFGMGYSVTASLIPAMVSDRFRGPHFGVIFGVSQIGSSVGSALGAWLAGWIFDATGSYALPFALAVGTAAAAGVAVWATRAWPPGGRG